LFAALGVPSAWPQDNHSFTAHANTIRGLHFQKQPKSQARLLRCTRGKIFNVCVDLRPQSPTFGAVETSFLTHEEGQWVYTPVDFAQGLLTLEDNTEVHVKMSEPFDPALRSGIRWDDPGLAIAWPLLHDQPPQVSPADQALPPFSMIGR
jgi:dTDP-4-dehydrorhamnose 3,5-epimerase